MNETLEGAIKESRHLHSLASTGLTRRYGRASARLGYDLKRLWWDVRERDGLIAVTHCGKLGDLIASLSVASWLFKTRGKKIHFVLARSFEPFTKIASLLMLQDMTAGVTLAEFPVRDWECGGTPYKFDPKRYYVPVGEYHNFGFRRHPRRFVPQYVAEELGIGYDPEFRLSLGAYECTNDVLCSDAHMLPEVPHATPIDFRVSLLDNARRLAGARESHVSQSGMFHILDWADVRLTRVYVYPHSVNMHLFTRGLNQLDVEYVRRMVRPGVSGK